jgi:hypothetical protein
VYRGVNDPGELLAECQHQSGTAWYRIDQGDDRPGVGVVQGDLQILPGQFEADGGSLQEAVHG